MAFVNCKQFNDLKDNVSDLKENVDELTKNSLTKEMLGEDIELKDGKLIVTSTGEEVVFANSAGDELTRVVASKGGK